MAIVRAFCGTEFKIDDDDLTRIKETFKRARFHISDGYVRVTNGHPYQQVHRFVMDAKEGDIIDHINRDPLDNQKHNLRICAHGQRDNRLNTGVARNNTTGYKGVHKRKDTGKYTARFCNRHLGQFDAPEDAARAYNKAALDSGEFVSLNEVF